MMKTKGKDITNRTIPSVKRINRCTQTLMQNGSRGFTLVEILVVVVILGVLAAIVVPQFTQASSEANLNTLLGNLQTVRSQIQLYKVQHRDLLPGQTTPGGDVTCDAFINALTEPGSVRAEPYLREIPANPFIADDAADDITIVNCMATGPYGGGHTGWWFNVATGDFRANDSRFHSVY